MSGKAMPLLKYFSVLFAAAFILNWFWEMLQMSAYQEMARLTWKETAVPCAIASLGDTAITFMIFVVGALGARRITWAIEPTWNVYLFAALLGAACAVAYEWVALGSGRWSYADQMPILPALNVGLWPVLQLTFLVPTTFWIAAKVHESFMTNTAPVHQAVTNDH